MRHILLFVSATFAAGCFNPDTSHITILCDATRPECPEGQTCLNNRCMPAQTDAGSEANDQSLSSDSGSGTADMPAASGCASGRGTQVGVAYACPGAFTSGAGRQQCAQGWKVCASATGIDQTKCDTVSGFFIADVPGFLVGATEMCTASTVNSLWFGCGGRQSSVRTATMQCGGFKKDMDCSASGWSCNMKHDLNQTSNSNVTDGVLCCP